MPNTNERGSPPSIHRIDLPCELTGFTRPPCDVHLKFLPSPGTGEGWTLLAHAAAGKPDQLARWLQPQHGVTEVRVAPGIAPKLLRAKAATLPDDWARVASFVKVHHLDLTREGNATWFIEGAREQVVALVQQLEATEPGRATRPPMTVRCRPVRTALREAPITRRQFEALATAVSMGYYEIPHRIDLRALAIRTGSSLGSVSELLRRAEGAILTHYVDSNLMGLPVSDEERDLGLATPHVPRPGIALGPQAFGAASSARTPPPPTAALPSSRRQSEPPSAK